MYGLTRGTMTLIGAGIAGFLIWFASWIGMDSTAEYWAFVGLLAAGGVAMALTQVIGGWTKWGRPTISRSVLLIGFLPTLIAAGWVLVAAQPNDNGPRDATRDWLAQIGLFENFLEVLIAVAPVIAFGLGLVFGLIFDTTGPRRREDEERDVYVGDEPTTAEREHVTTVPPATTESREREPAHVGGGAEDERHEHPRRRFFGR